MNKEQKHEHGFKVPKEYFETFDAQLELKMMEEKLPSIPSMGVPDNYFNSLEDEIVAKIKKSDLGPSKVIQLFEKRTLIYLGSLAASLVLIFMFSNERSKSDSDEINYADIETYIEQGAVDFDSDDMALFLNDEDLDFISNNTSIASDADLEEYLFDTLDDTTLLNE